MQLIRLSMFVAVMTPEIRLFHHCELVPTNSLRRTGFPFASTTKKSLNTCSQHLVESQSMKAFLKTKWVQPTTSKVSLIKWPVSMLYIFFCLMVNVMFSLSIFLTCHFAFLQVLFTCQPHEATFARIVSRAFVCRSVSVCG